MGNGEWGMGNGEWGMDNGQWGMVVEILADFFDFIRVNRDKRGFAGYISFNRDYSVAQG